MTDDTQATTTIEIGEPGRSFYAGISAGTKAYDALLTQTDAPHEQRVAFFWMTVGRLMQADYPTPTPEGVVQYVHGAAMRAPHDDRLLVLGLDKELLEGDDQDQDDQAVYEQYAHYLRHVARELEQGGYRDDADNTLYTITDPQVRVGNIRLNTHG